jgi:GNAT superfamily N-acetyltransferase
MSAIERLSAEHARLALPELVALLQDVVHDGASVGFLRPLADDQAKRFWHDIIRDVNDGSRVLLVTRREGRIIGTAQLALCMKPNGPHRAEVQKLMVHTAWRGQGIAKALMATIEAEARAANRSLLCLDTEADKPAETLYERSGWVRMGEVPDYACSREGELHDVVFFYRRI